ncbi:hypothetical protein CLOSTMETH_01388 [[Clostridium] methylpentosum DSM 5476]|uniref:Uncharacterized protein n=1 Tax=[Clostridium] methylpentosum DSM 5476 TaxID=537013 RepID=C0EC19_9FIRM|nr:hypothetical protein CLOSTMETH_01388 [[Clostridium] methylpentosum DSM 5476]
MYQIHLLVLCINIIFRLTYFVNTIKIHKNNYFYFDTMLLFKYLTIR